VENDESMKDIRSRISDALLMDKEEYNIYVDAV
jgi:hypothetical protein